MKLNLKSFKKVSSDAHSTTMRNNAGHEVKIAHKSLHPEMRQQLAALPTVGQGDLNSVNKSSKFADGGQVPEPNKKAAQEIQQGATQSGWQPKKWAENIKSAVGLAEGGEVGETLAVNTQMPAIPEDLVNSAPAPASPVIENMTPEQMAASAPAESLPYGVTPPQGEPELAPQVHPEVTPPAPAPQPAAPSGAGDPYGSNAYQDAYMQGLNSERAGLVKEAQAVDIQGKAQAALLGKQQAIQAQQASEFQTHYKALDAERQALMHDIQQNHIDPNHFVNTMDGSSKIATAIGLIASGMGSAMAGQSNMAADFLHRQIENDIQAQKTQLGQKENLLSANMRQFGNMRDAMDMTRVMQSDILANQLRTEATKQMGPMAQANLLKAAGDLEMKSAPVLSQIAMRKTLLSGMANGRVAPESVIRMVVPEGEQAGATKELKEAESAYRAKDNVISAWDRISNLNTLGNRVLSPLQSGRQVAALRDPVVASLSKETAGRFTEQDSHMLGTLFPSPGDDASTLATKRAQTVKLISEKLNYPELKKWGIDLSNTGRYDNTGKPRIPEGKPVR